MKKIDKKGFTLIELLAVIVILGVIMFVAIPSISKIVAKSQRDTFVSSGKNFIGGARNAAVQGTYYFPLAAKTDATIIPIKLIDLEKGGDKSTFDEEWNYNQSYVAIVNTGTQENPHYDYYFTALDKGGHGIALAEEKSLNSDNVTTRVEPTDISTFCTSATNGERVVVNGSITGLPGVTKLYVYCAK